MDALTRRAIDVDEANRSLGAETFTACGATFVRSPALPIIHDLNHVACVRAADPAGIDALMARMEVEFAGFRHRQVVVDADTPPAVVARLVLDGYDDVESSLVMLLEDELRGSARSHAIRAVTIGQWRATQVRRGRDRTKCGGARRRKGPHKEGTGAAKG